MNPLETSAAIVGIIVGIIWLILLWKFITIILPVTGLSYWITHIVLIIIISLFSISCLRRIQE